MVAHPYLKGQQVPEMQVKKGSRLKQFIDWLGEDPHGPLIIFDECHKAKNMLTDQGLPTKTALCVVRAAVCGRWVGGRWAVGSK